MSDDLLPRHPVSIDDMIEEIQRECQMRREVYGRACREGRMNRRRADRRIDVMDAVLNHLEREREHERGAMDDRR
jgi:hypothetical protein